MFDSIESSSISNNMIILFDSIESSSISKLEGNVSDVTLYLYLFLFLNDCVGILNCSVKCWKESLTG